MGDHKINFLKSLAIVINDQSLEKSFTEFYAKSKKAGFMSFTNTITLLDRLEKYLKENKSKFQKTELSGLADLLVIIYKDKLVKKDIKGKQIREFNYSINFILLSLGVMPIKEDGNQMSVPEAKKFITDVYKKH